MLEPLPGTADTAAARHTPPDLKDGESRRLLALFLRGGDWAERVWITCPGAELQGQSLRPSTQDLGVITAERLAHWGF